MKHEKGINPKTVGLGPAKILHPLRYAKRKDHVLVETGKGTVRVYGELARMAIHAATAGDGQGVNLMAMHLNKN